MPAYPYMPCYGAAVPEAWVAPFPGNPYGPVLAMPPAKSGKAPSTAPPKPPAPSTKASTKKSPPTEEKVHGFSTGVHFESLHPTVAKLRSVKCGESSPGGDNFITLEQWQKFCNATEDDKKEERGTSPKHRKLAHGPEGAKAKSVKSAEFGNDFEAFLEWNKLRKQAKEAAKKAEAKLATKVDKTASEIAKSSKSAKSAAHSHNSYAPPSIRPGVNYLFPDKTQHTMLHVFNKTSKLWTDEKYAKTAQKFKIFKVATHFSVGNIIERVRQGKENAAGWAVTEVVEKGSGGWAKGTTIKYDDEKAKGSLESMGWDAKRGSEARPPVWVVVHKA